jgi:hypothetical protein
MLINRLLVSLVIVAALVARAPIPAADASDRGCLRTPAAPEAPCRPLWLPIASRRS